MMALSLLIVPWLAAFLFLLPKAAAKAGAVVLAAVEVLLFLLVLGGNRSGVNWNWIPDLGVHFHVAPDGLALFLVGLTTVLVLAAVLASSRDRGPAYFFWILGLESSALGVFMALDLVTFYVFWEVVLIPVFFLLSGFGGPNGHTAALKWLIMNLFGSFLMLIGVVAMGVVHSQETGRLTFQLAALAHTSLAGTAAPWIFLAFLIAFIIKAPLWPLHGWMPAAYGEAPPQVTALLSGVLSKLGVFGMIRVLVPLFLPQMRAWEPWLMILAGIGLVYGASIALRQTDVKMVVSYASLSHMAMISLGIFTLTAAGMMGATFYMVAHGLMTGGLFLILGWLEDRAGDRGLESLSGLNHGVPRLAAWFQLFALATLGLPGLPGFAGEYMIFQGLVRDNVAVAAVAAVVLVLASWYMLRLFQGAMQGPRRDTGYGDLSASQVALIGVMGALVVLIGVWPAAITSHVGQILPGLHLPLALGGAPHVFWALVREGRWIG
jgi:NADH-quinone oxidoreductase subunit M